MPKDALPDRYVVDRKGSPDPEGSEYYVLDVVHDRHARTVLGRLVNYYRQHGQQVAADELVSFLDATVDAHKAVIEKWAEKSAPRSTPSARRTKAPIGEAQGRKS